MCGVLRVLGDVYCGVGVMCCISYGVLCGVGRVLWDVRWYVCV